MNRIILILLMGIAACVAGCTMSQQYTRPDAPIPSRWPGKSVEQTTTTDAPSAQNLEWREFITDEKLQQVIETALKNNRDLRLASLNVELARATYGIQRDALFPSVHAAGSAVKQHSAADFSQPGQSRTTERYDVNLGIAAWEIDFFGRIRSLKDEALQTYFASEQARRSAQLLLVSAIAQTYMTLAANRENLQLAQTTLKTQQEIFDLIKRNYDLGIVTELDLNRAQIQIETARGAVALYQQRVAQDENALNLLVGAPLPDSLLPTALSSIAPLPEISPGISSEVLLSRPDVLQAENLLKAANADIGAARAAFFPRISLTTIFGTASKDLSGLFKDGSTAWNFTPQIVMPIFDARTWSAHKAAKVQREIALTRYEKAIQTAFREVADVLAVRDTVDQQLAAQESLVKTLTEIHRLAMSRYEKGIDSYLGVLDAQRTLFAAQQGLVSLRLAKQANNVRLYAVLGGGW